MKIFISDSTKSDNEESLIIPLQNSKLSEEHELVFRHELPPETSVKDTIRDCDLVLAELSNPTFEQGIELGWANEAYVTIIATCSSKTTLPEIAPQLTADLSTYENIDELIQLIQKAATNL